MTGTITTRGPWQTRQAPHEPPSSTRTRLHVPEPPAVDTADRSCQPDFNIAVANRRG